MQEMPEDAGKRRVRPTSIPKAQQYYWSRSWQVAEREALREIEGGQGVEFSEPVDAVRWLLDDEGTGT